MIQLDAKVLTVACVTALLFLGFQNCSSKNFDAQADLSSSQSANGEGSVAVVPGASSELQNAQGQKLRFTNIRNQPVGTLSIESRSANDILVNMYNPLTGRGSKVRVKVNPTTGAFTGVERADAHAYLCRDQAQSVCASIDSAPNCSSPVYFHGSISGSVENLREPAESQYCGTVFSAADRATWL